MVDHGVAGERVAVGCGLDDAVLDHERLREERLLGRDGKRRGCDGDGERRDDEAQRVLH